MGLGRTLECCSGLLNSVNKNKNKKKNTKKKQLQTVELKVRMDCEGCELKIKKALFKMKGLILLCFLLSVCVWGVCSCGDN